MCYSISMGLHERLASNPFMGELGFLPILATDASSSKALGSISSLCYTDFLTIENPGYVDSPNQTNFPAMSATPFLKLE